MRNYASLYLGLLSDLELEEKPDAHIFSDMGDRLSAKVSLANSFYKKLAPKGNSRVADEAALIKFKAINSAIPEGPFEFSASSEAESLFWDFFVGHYQKCLAPHESLGSFDLDYIRGHMDVGPGAAQKADSRTMITKLFESPMSYMNPHLIPLYRAALSETGYWADAEMRRFQEYGFVQVTGGKLFFASKNSEISRTCCTEASLEILFQKAICAFYEERIKWYFGISLKDQPTFNREMARIGSIDGSIGTIDLVSASDSIRLALIERIQENNFLRSMLLGARSKSAVLPDGSKIDLRMVSTMGNAFTFPLQTLIFACAVRSVYQLMGLPSDCCRTQFGVFGDDICCNKVAYDFLCRMLNKLGFEVNVRKSFNTGPFRESCGHDYVNGRNIRGVYIKSLETPQNVYSAINRLTRWSAFHEIRLDTTLNLLKTWAREIRVPPCEDDEAGIHVPFRACGKPKLTSTYWFLYRCHARRLRRLDIKEDEDGNVVGQTSDAYAIGFLSGIYRRRDVLLNSTEDSAWKHDLSISVSLRERVGARPRYKVVTRSVPYWDYLPGNKTPEESTRYEPDEWRVPLARDNYQAWGDLVVDLLSR